MINLTLLEKDVIYAIGTNEFSDEPGSEIWSFSIMYGCKLTTKDQISGVVSSLVKKGLVKHRSADKEDKSDNDTVWLTAEGIEAFKSLNDDVKRE